MPCLLAILALAFPRVAIVLLYLFTRFFDGVYQGLLIPVLGFLFLPLTLIVYTYFHNTHTAIGLVQIVILFVAVIIDLGLVSTGTFRRRRS